MYKKIYFKGLYWLIMGLRRDVKFKDKFCFKIFNVRLVILDSKYFDEMVK